MKDYRSICLIKEWLNQLADNRIIYESNFIVIYRLEQMREKAMRFFSKFANVALSQNKGVLGLLTTRISSTIMEEKALRKLLTNIPHEVLS